MGNVKTAEEKAVRLEALNTEAKERIKTLRANFANERQVANVIRGLRFREAEIARLRK